MLKKGTLGPGILGVDRYEQELEETTKGRQVFGHGITGARPDPKLFPKDYAAWLKDHPEEAEKEEIQPESDPADVDDPAGEPPQERPRETEEQPFPDMSLENLKDILIKNSKFLDGAIETEFKREPTPRRGALRFFLEIEQGEQKRPDVLKRLEDAMG